MFSYDMGSFPGIVIIQPGIAQQNTLQGRRLWENSGKLTENEKEDF